MSVILAKALCLHAHAADLGFLNPVRNRMGRVIGGGFRGHVLANKASHAQGRFELSSSGRAFVVVFAHGGRSYIRGGGVVNRATGEVIEEPRFVTHRDAALFSDQVVFCLDCDSNELAQSCLSAGALSFVGFDGVPFDRFDENGNPITNHEFEVHTQRLLAGAIMSTMERFLSGKSTLVEARETGCHYFPDSGNPHNPPQICLP